MVGWTLSIGLIDLPFSHWTHVTFKHTLPGKEAAGQRTNEVNRSEEKTEGVESVDSEHIKTAVQKPVKKQYN
jgi:hypothetical protein